MKRCIQLLKIKDLAKKVFKEKNAFPVNLSKFAENQPRREEIKLSIRFCSFKKRNVLRSSNKNEDE